jgi:hypothetical protein
MRKRAHRIWAHLSDDEYEAFRCSVKKSGLSQEAYLRALIKGRIPRQPPPVDYYAMMKELRAIGNRINQIAARANAIGFIDAEQYEKNARELHDALLRIQAAVVLPERI